MKSIIVTSGLLLSQAALLCGCAGSKFGSAKNHEQILMHADMKRNVINYSRIKTQGAPQPLAARGPGRGVLEAYTGGLISLGVTAVKSMIANDKKKYTGSWKQGLNDLYFYDQPSDQGPFDPAGMQFNGFSLKRTFEQTNSSAALVAFDAAFELDTANYNEIINDGVFRLRVRDLRINYSRAKVPPAKNYINADLTISFFSSYIGENGQLYKDIELGKFVLTLRKAPLDSTTAGYQTYYHKLKDSLLTGKCFIVPRSYGYYKQANNTIVPLYNQGPFSITVTVTESSRDSFIDEMLLNSAAIGIDYSQEVLMQKMKPKASKKRTSDH